MPGRYITATTTSVAYLLFGKSTEELRHTLGVVVAVW